MKIREHAPLGPDVLPAFVEMPAPAMTTILRCCRMVFSSKSICGCCSERESSAEGDKSRCWVVRSLGPTRRLFFAGGRSWQWSARGSSASCDGGGDGSADGEQGDGGGELSPELSEK